MAARCASRLALAAALLAASPETVGAVQQKFDFDIDPTRASGDLLINEQDKPRSCRKPEAGEKIVYFVVHGETEDGDNAQLSDVGEIQARQLPKDALLGQALSQNGMYRAQAVIVAPWKKSMQTAMMAFGDELHKATWEVSHDVKGVDGSGGTDFKEAEAFVRNYKAGANLMRRYQERYEATASAELTAEQRFKRFTNELRGRNETNIIVVSTPFEAHMAGIELGEGEVDVFALRQEEEALKQGGDYRELSKPHLWVHCSKLNDASWDGGIEYYLKGIFNHEKREQYEAWEASHQGGVPASVLGSYLDAQAPMK